MLNRAVNAGMNRLVRKSSFVGRVRLKLISGFGSTGFRVFLHLLADFFSCGGGDARGGLGGAEPVRKEFTCSSLGARGSGTFFFLRNLFIVILNKLAAVDLRRCGGLEGIAVLQPSIKRNRHTR